MKLPKTNPCNMTHSTQKRCLALLISALMASGTLPAYRPAGARKRKAGTLAAEPLEGSLPAKHALVENIVSDDDEEEHPLFKSCDTSPKKRAAPFDSNARKPVKAPKLAECFAASRAGSSASTRVPSSVGTGNTSSSTASTFKIPLGHAWCQICPRHFEIRRMVNIGCRKYPTWRCKPCNRAATVIDNAAKSRGDSAQKALTTHKRTDPGGWKRDVQKIRIAADDEEPIEDEELSVFNNRDRLVEARNLLQTVCVRYGGERRMPTALMTERQFKGYYTTMEMMSKLEVDQKWDKEFNNKAVYREQNKSGELCLAVTMPTMISHLQSWQHGNTTQEQSPYTQTETAALMQQLKAFMDNPTWQQLFGGQADQALAVAGSASTSETYNKPAQLTTDTTGGGVQTALARALEGDGASVRSELADAPNFDVLGLVKVRRLLRKETHNFINHHFNAKKSAYRELSSVASKLGSDHREVQALQLEDPVDS